MWTQSSLDMEPIVSQGWLSWTSFSLALAVTSEPSVFVFWPRPYFKWSLLRCPPQTIKVCDLIAANIVVSKSISVAFKATLTFIGVYTNIVSVSVSIWHVANMPCGHKHFKYGQNSQKVKKGCRQTKRPLWPFKSSWFKSPWKVDKSIAPVELVRE